MLAGAFAVNTRTVWRCRLTDGGCSEWTALHACSSYSVSEGDVSHEWCVWMWRGSEVQPLAAMELSCWCCGGSGGVSTAQGSLLSLLMQCVNQGALASTSGRRHSCGGVPLKQ